MKFSFFFPTLHKQQTQVNLNFNKQKSEKRAWIPLTLHNEAFKVQDMGQDNG